MLLDPKCALCGALGVVVCASCEASLATAPQLPAPLHLSSCLALCSYDDSARELVTGLKNHHRRDVVAWFATRMAGLVLPSGASCVTWAPTSPARRLARGFDQAELLARAVARRARLPVRPLLRRVPGPPQSGASAADRKARPAFELRRRATTGVLLVDDVATTGATLTAAAGALRAGGAPEVHALVVARAPLPGSAKQ